MANSIDRYFLSIYDVLSTVGLTEVTKKPQPLSDPR